MKPKSDKEIKELIAGFEAPVRRTKKVIASMRSKLGKANIKGDAYDEALRKIDDVESLVNYTTSVQVELNGSNETVGKWLVAYVELKQKYENKCKDLHTLELISEMGWEEYKIYIEEFYESEIYPHFPEGAIKP